MKWSNIIAQGFSPGRSQPRNRPVGATDECDVNRESHPSTDDYPTSISQVLHSAALTGRARLWPAPRAKALGYDL
jgi:hypothetical protein